MVFFVSCTLESALRQKLSTIEVALELDQKPVFRQTVEDIQDCIRQGSSALESVIRWRLSAIELDWPKFCLVGKKTSMTIAFFASLAV